LRFPLSLGVFYAFKLGVYNRNRFISGGSEPIDPPKYANDYNALTLYQYAHMRIVDSSTVSIFFKSEF